MIVLNPLTNYSAWTVQYWQQWNHKKYALFPYFAVVQSLQIKHSQNWKNKEGDGKRDLEFAMKSEKASASSLQTTSYGTGIITIYFILNKVSLVLCHTFLKAHLLFQMSEVCLGHFGTVLKKERINKIFYYN